MSVDSKNCHKAWIEKELGGEIRYPLLADLTKKAARDYGVLLEESGVALRATFLIDPEGIVRWMSVYDLSTGRSVDEVLRVLRALKTGELCPVSWRPGMPTIKA